MGWGLGGGRGDCGGIQEEGIGGIVGGSQVLSLPLQCQAKLVIWKEMVVLGV